MYIQLKKQQQQKISFLLLGSVPFCVGVGPFFCLLFVVGVGPFLCSCRLLLGSVPFLSGAGSKSYHYIIGFYTLCVATYKRILICRLLQIAFATLIWSLTRYYKILYILVYFRTDPNKKRDRPQ